MNNESVHARVARLWPDLRHVLGALDDDELLTSCTVLHTTGLYLLAQVRSAHGVESTLQRRVHPDQWADVTQEQHPIERLAAIGRQLHTSSLMAAAVRASNTEAECRRAFLAARTAAHRRVLLDWERRAQAARDAALAALGEPCKTS